MDLTDFVDIIGYEGLYKINKNGEIYGIIQNKIKKQCLDNNGYYIINLCKNCKQKVCQIHRLIAINFISNEDSTKNQVDHIDGIRTNNNIFNLRWVTKTENMRNQLRNTNYIYEYIRNEKIFYKSQYPIYINGKYIRKIKQSIHRHIVEEWVEQMKKDYPNQYTAGRLLDI